MSKRRKPVKRPKPVTHAQFASALFEAWRVPGVVKIGKVN